jgi:hypothetical protein
MFGRENKDTAFTQAHLLTDAPITFSKKKVFSICFVVSLALVSLYSIAAGNDSDLNG